MENGAPQLRWGTEQRLEFIEFRLFWDGGIRRADLTGRFGVSVPQASSDLAQYRALAPDNIRYDLSEKRYLATSTFRPKILKPNAERYLAQLRAISDDVISPEDTWIRETGNVGVTPVPARRVDPATLRIFLKAVRERRSISVEYQSTNDRRPEPMWRQISPHAFGNDGLRWHLRAYCHLENLFKDFILSRCLQIGELGETMIDPAGDTAWTNHFGLILIPNPKLSKAQQRAIERDYGMRDGRCELRVRRALLYYLDKRLRLDVAEKQDRPKETPVVVANRAEYETALKESPIRMRSEVRLATQYQGDGRKRSVQTKKLRGDVRHNRYKERRQSDGGLGVSASSSWDALRSIAARMPKVVREHEVLRVAAVVHGKDRSKSAEAARREVLLWAQKRSGGRLPPDAWAFQEYEYFSGGRNSVAVRIKTDEADIWAIRADDPDDTVPGRTWTNEAVIGMRSDGPCHFSARQIVYTVEDGLEIEPHPPGFVQQIADRCVLSCGPIDLSPEPWLIESEEDAERLTEVLIDQSRSLPLFVLTVPEESTDPNRPLLDGSSLARVTLGIAQVVILPAAFTWTLTGRFGKQRSVFGGAVRAYLSGFAEDASPYGHRLVLADYVSKPEGAAQCIRWMRSVAAAESVRRTRLGADVLAFATMRNATLQLRQQQLEREGASDTQKLDAANARIKALEADLKSATETENFLLDEQNATEQRAHAAEAQANAASLRIQQLLDQIKRRGQTPDADIQLPEAWRTFGDWCDHNLVGRVVLAPQARNSVRKSVFEDPKLAARCLLWLANEYRDRRLEGGDGSLRDHVLEPGIRNSPCGADEFRLWWQGQQHTTEWHIKNGGNTRDPRRCLRIYYFWDAITQQVVIADMPAHRHTGAT